MRRLLFSVIASIAVWQYVDCQNADTLSDWENQKVFGINKSYYHVNVVPYPDLESSLKMDYTQSAFYKSLNGTWKLNYVNKPSDAPADFYTSPNIPYPAGKM